MIVMGTGKGGGGGAVGSQLLKKIKWDGELHYVFFPSRLVHRDPFLVVVPKEKES